MKKKKIDVIKELREMKREGFNLEGVFVAWTNKNGRTGTTAIVDNIGVTMRLIVEAKIQEKAIEEFIDSQAKRKLQTTKMKEEKQNYVG